MKIIAFILSVFYAASAPVRIKLTNIPVLTTALLSTNPLAGFRHSALDVPTSFPKGIPTHLHGGLNAVAQVSRKESEERADAFLSGLRRLRQEKEFTIADGKFKNILDVDQLRLETNTKGVFDIKSAAVVVATGALTTSAPRLFSNSSPEATQRQNVGPIAVVAASAASKKSNEYNALKKIPS